MYLSYAHAGSELRHAFMAIAGGGFSLGIGAALTIDGGSVIANCHAIVFGGAIVMLSHSVTVIRGGSVIANCSAGDSAGAVFVGEGSSLVLTEGSMIYGIYRDRRLLTRGEKRAYTRERERERERVCPSTSSRVFSEHPRECPKVCVCASNRYS